MFTYFKMKKKEIKLKLELYSSIENFMEEKDDIIETIKKVYLSLKDVPVEEMYNKLITELANIIHDDNEDELSDK